MTNFDFSEYLIKLSDVADKCFLKYNGLKNGNQILIFSSNQFLNELKKSSAWYMDGTFKLAPISYNHFFTIHGFSGKLFILLLFTLLATKLFYRINYYFKKCLSLLIIFYLV